MRAGSAAAPGSPKPARIDSVGFLRGLAMMCLALVHSVLYFTPLNEDIDFINAFFAYGLGDIGAALFTTLVGVSFVLSMRSRQSHDANHASLRAAFVRHAPGRPAKNWAGRVGVRPLLAAKTS